MKTNEEYRLIEQKLAESLAREVELKEHLKKAVSYFARYKEADDYSVVISAIVNGQVDDKPLREMIEAAGEVMRRRIMLDRGTMTMHEWYWHKNRISEINAVTLKDLK